MIIRKMIINIYICFFLAWMVIPSFLYAGNIIYNTSYELQSTNNLNKNMLIGWKASKSNHVSKIICSDYVHTGSNAVKMSESHQSLSLERNLTTNDYGSFSDKGVILSVWALTPEDDPLVGEFGGIELSFYNKNGDLCNPGRVSAPVIDYSSKNDTWIYGSISDLVPANCVGIDVVLKRSGGPAGTVYFDDVAIRLVPAYEFIPENSNLTMITDVTVNQSCEAWLQSTNISMNLIDNSGFEDCKTLHEPKDGFTASGWGRWEIGPIGPKQSSRFAHTGKYSARIYNDKHSVFPYMHFHTNDYGGFSGKEISLSAWAMTPANAKLSNSVGKLMLEFYDYENKTCTPFQVWKTVISPTNQTDKWIEQTLFTCVPDSCVRIDVFLSKGYDGTISDDVDRETYKKLYSGAGEVYFDDVEMCIIDKDTQLGEKIETKKEEERKWQIAGPFMLSSAGIYDSNYFLSIFKNLPDVFDNNAPDIKFDTIPFAKIEPHEYFLPHVKPKVIWNTTVTNGCIQGYITLFSKWHAFGCTISMPWNCLKINGRLASKRITLHRGVTNIFLTYSPKMRKAHETNASIIVNYGRHGLFKIPVECEYNNGEWRLKRKGIDSTGIFDQLKPSYWRKIASVREHPDGMALVNEHSLLFAQYIWISPIEQAAVLKLGSDDAVKIWHNGKHIYMYPYGRGYVPSDDILPLTLIKGTNYFLFALINGVGEADLGVNLYSFLKPLNGQIKLKALSNNHVSDILTNIVNYTSAVLTGDSISIDFLWLQASAINYIPHWAPVCDRPLCEILSIKGPGMQSAIYDGSNIKSEAFPLLLDMNGKPDGVYRIEAIWDGKLHTSSFLYFSSNRVFNATQRWWLRLIDAIPEVDLADMFDAYRTEKDFYSKFSGRTVRAYDSKYDNSLQPYGLEVPEELKGQSNVPLVVYLEAEQAITPEIWSKKFLGRTAEMKDCIQVRPFGRGNRPHEGLVEKDVMNVIEDVCRVFSIDRDRIYLEGHCQGAAGVWRMASKYPYLFAAFMPNSGFPYQLFMSGIYKNTLNVPCWHYHPEFFNPQLAEHAVQELKKMGGDARIYIQKGGGKGSSDSYVLNDIRKWMFKQKRKKNPYSVYFSTYGDYTGAYWIKDILPQKFGQLATVYAEVNTNTLMEIEEYKNNNVNSDINTVTTNYPTINVSLDNISQFSLDLTGKPFTNYNEWLIYIDKQGPYSRKPGDIVQLILEINGASPTGLKKMPGMCGGLADIINAGFVVAYATGSDGKTLKERAENFCDKFIGQGFGRMAGNFPLIADTNITAELCHNRNIILILDPDIPGIWYKSHKKHFPVAFTDKSIELGGKKGKEMVCIYPNPLATNRYVLLVSVENINSKLIWLNHFDVILDQLTGSFDIFWNDVKWNMEGRNANDNNYEKTKGIHGMDRNDELKSISIGKKEPTWKSLGSIICGGGLALIILFYLVKFKYQHKSEQ